MAAQPTMILDTELALEQIGDTDAMNGMLVMLQESLARDIPHIADLLQAGDVAQANRLLHALKGFVPIFCRSDFCEQVVAVEGLSKDSSSVTVGPAYMALRPQLDQLLADVQGYLAGIGQ
jgi:hypothetical protein